VFSVSAIERTRAASWQQGGDTLTIDATDGDSWRYVSLSQGRALVAPDTTAWDIAVQRYRVITPLGGDIADIGAQPFDSARLPPDAHFVPTIASEHPENPVIDHWYRYNLLTHLLEPNGHIFAVRTSGGALWKLAVVSYYCPKLVAGCLTVRYAPLTR
jgi:hypothetical protein